MTAENEDVLYGHPPVAEEMLNLDALSITKPTMQKARRHLVAKKRAALIAALLHARLVLIQQHEALVNPETVSQALGADEVQGAINTVLIAVKSRFAGINMLEISTCGAIPPYNHILGGKLASLLLFSPQIAADYRRIYGRPSIIASQMKNEPVCRPNELVYLGTTSLYFQGSSQYERLRLPAGTISPDQPELRFAKIGQTSGFGTLQFPAQTCESVERYLSSVQRFQDVNSIFGEGPSPKLRKLAAGLREIGFPPDALMRHNRPRLIYSVPLCPQALDYLNARSCELPSYIRNPENFTDATERIVCFWKTRWLTSRLKHQPSIIALLTTKTWKLSERMSVETDSKTQPSVFNKKFQVGAPTLWHQIAASGPKVTSEALSPEELDTLHIEQPIEHFLRKLVQAGHSIFLTGNAGDGKTHLLRRLRNDLIAVGAEVIEDATAVMRQGDMSPILDRWRRAVADERPFCIAINEYPLYLLRKEANLIFPELVAELSRQTTQRLTYGTIRDDEFARHKVLIVDLSLRNPLRRSFASSCLKRIVFDENLSKFAHPGTSLAYNLERLQNSFVQERLLTLFDRLATQGVRATVRELWIVLARIVLGYRSDLKESLGDGVSHWYSEALFQSDNRFQLFEAISTRDPGFISHPIWDVKIEEACPSLAAGWCCNTPPIRATTRPERQDFLALKRAFYFEHTQGEACLKMESEDVARYEELTAQGVNQDYVDRNTVIGAINRAYCPVPFSGIQDNLHLWNGHRFHEQPSEVFLANKRIPSDEFSLFPPRLPTRTEQAFPDYKPDHLALVFNQKPSVLLKIDCDLFKTLWKLQKGLPRKLLADQDVFRLEQFLDFLYAFAPTPERRLLSANLKRRELIEVHLNSEGNKYDRIIKA